MTKHTKWPHFHSYYCWSHKKCPHISLGHVSTVPKSINLLGTVCKIPAFVLTDYQKSAKYRKCGMLLPKTIIFSSISYSIPPPSCAFFKVQREHWEKGPVVVQCTCMFCDLSSNLLYVFSLSFFLRRGEGILKVKSFGRVKGYRKPCAEATRWTKYGACIHTNQSTFIYASYALTSQCPLGFWVSVLLEACW